MECLIKRKYSFDRAVIVVSAVLSWIALFAVLKTVNGLADTYAIKIASISTCLAAGILSSGALFAVLIHLKTNRDDIYREDMGCNE